MTRGNFPLKSIYPTGGDVSDCKGSKVLLDRLPRRVEHFLGDMGCDSNEIQNILESMGITPRILGRTCGTNPFSRQKILQAASQD